MSRKQITHIGTSNSIIPHTDTARKPYPHPLTEADRRFLEKTYDPVTAREIIAWPMPVRWKKKPRVRKDDTDRPRNQYHCLAVAPVQLVRLLPDYSRLIADTSGMVMRAVKAITRRFGWKPSESWESCHSAVDIAEYVGCKEREAQALIAVIKRKCNGILRVESSRPNHYRLNPDSDVWTDRDLARMLRACRDGMLHEALRHLRRFTVVHFGREFNWTAYKLACFLHLDPDYPVLTPPQRSVVEAMSWRADYKTGMVEISIPEIVRETGFGRSAVKEAIRILKKKEYGVIIIPDGGEASGHRSNRYLLRFYDPQNW